MYPRLFFVVFVLLGALAPSLAAPVQSSESLSLEARTYDLSSETGSMTSRDVEGFMAERDYEDEEGQFARAIELDILPRSQKPVAAHPAANTANKPILQAQPVLKNGQPGNVRAAANAGHKAPPSGGGTAERRIQQELREILGHPIPGLSVAPTHNLFEWKCAIRANPDSPYRGGIFHFDFSLPPNFPFRAPVVTFKTRIYHSGVNDHRDGAISVRLLRDAWNPAVSLSTVLASIQEKVNNPSPHDPFEPNIAAQLMHDRARFLAIAQDWTRKYASR
ncbi:ubiquitin-conjugating enzyme/RWD-like protein [Flammula alnicola]|nr:ubiquitin-conjugating enzyme/RWD-like protein [Flammula alnicola]